MTINMTKRIIASICFSIICSPVLAETDSTVYWSIRGDNCEAEFVVHVEAEDALYLSYGAGAVIINDNEDFFSEFMKFVTKEVGFSVVNRIGKFLRYATKAGQSCAASGWCSSVARAAQLFANYFPNSRQKKNISNGVLFHFYPDDPYVSPDLKRPPSDFRSYQKFMVSGSLYVEINDWYCRDNTGYF